MRRVAGPCSAAAVLIGSSAAGQCPPQWASTGLHVGGPDSGPEHVTVWDPDGSGPQPPLLVISGDFGVVDGIIADRIAAWDGQTWHALPNPGFKPSALAARPGQLIAAGKNAAGPVVGAWDGERWTVLGTGAPANHGVLTVAFYNDELYAGGNLDSFGGATGKLVRLVGSDWVAVPGAFPGLYEYPVTMTTYGDRLAIGGDDELDLWDGTAVVRDTSAYNQILTLTVHAGELYQSTHTFMTAGLVWRWTGAGWEMQGANLWPSFQQAWVLSLCSYAGDLYASGDFVIQGSSPGANFARWRNGQWEPVPFGGGGWPLTVYRDQLIASPPLPAANIGAWDGAQWRALASLPRFSGGINDLKRIGGDVWACGFFSLVDESGDAARCVARLHEGRWIAEPPLPASGARALEEYGGTVYVAAWSDSHTAPSVYRRSVSGWEAVNNSSNGDGVMALAVWDGSLLAGGVVPVGNDYVWLARWDGTSWTRMADPPGEVFGLKVIEGELYSCGVIYNTASLGYVARFESGGWVTLGAPFNTVVYTLGTFGPALVAGGPFASVGGVGVQHIARWNGQAWAPIGDGVPAFVYSILQRGPGLLAGGATYTPNSYYPYLAKLYAWDGGSWTELGVGGPREYAFVNALLPDGDGTWVGGSFRTVGGQVAPALARRADPCYANCDGSTASPAVNVLDFLCFLNRFAAGDPYANCDGSTAAPTLNVLDFSCFLNKFVAGCSGC